MAFNATELTSIVDGLFDVLSAIITNVTDLITGDLLVLAIIGGFISLILGLFGLVYLMIKKATSSSVGAVNMRGNK